MPPENIRKPMVFREYRKRSMVWDGSKHHSSHKKMKFTINDFFSKYDHIRSFLRIWSHLLNKSLMENFIFLCTDCAARISLLLIVIVEQRLKCFELVNIWERVINGVFSITLYNLKPIDRVIFSVYIYHNLWS